MNRRANKAMPALTRGGTPLWRLALGLASMAASQWAAGQEIRITPGDCNQRVHLVARNATLSGVLAQLGQVLDFELRYDRGDDPPVNVDVSRQPPELVAKLVPMNSVIVTQARNPRCPGHYRIVKVWVLGNARSGPSTRVVPSPAIPQLLLDRLRNGEEAMSEATRTDGVPRHP